MTGYSASGRVVTWRLSQTRALFLVLLLPALLGSGVQAASAKPSQQGSPVTASRPGPKAKPSVSAVPRQPKLQRPKVVVRSGKAPRQVAQSRPRKAAPALPLVVVDAGHGGRDPGAVGPSGTLEKTVVLATAQELGRQLRATRRYRVLFTRDSDRFVSLSDRVRLAAASNAALMISIHADGSPDRRARGASVYVRPAQSVGADVVQVPAHRGSSRAIARALSRPAPVRGSGRLQLALIDNLDDDLTMVPDPARQGSFHVLGAIGIPSVLVETGFITNRADESLLRTPKHRATIARSIRDAVDEFFVSRSRRSGARL